ncbi:MAG: hypothetical protein RIB80_04830 [Rhodospirillales bacterium]
MRSDDINGHINRTGSWVKVETVSLTLSHDDAWALVNVISRRALDKRRPALGLEEDQYEALARIGHALAKFIDHPARDEEPSVSGGEK